MQPTQLLQLAAAAWQGPALCSFSGLYISQSAATYSAGGTRWHVAINLADRPACQPAGGFAGSSLCPFDALRQAFRALRAVAPAYAFAAVWEVMKAEDEYAGVPAHV
ncbi:hypothetical protein [Hymenobacter rubripertinctus]|uniref:Uncharacterized protein n=1 Tax=Hymenobacter rubripertinctus TaxID=2029981 RepID=A0A418R2N2_9BACT|nr:hypothetical protein [Hymenobacter rubripertinctus]RIY11790.1 hypothetical protein D0T11_06420 [Hymenobacter rubripertinctus]